MVRALYRRLTCTAAGLAVGNKISNTAENYPASEDTVVTNVDEIGVITPAPAHVSRRLAANELFPDLFVIQQESILSQRI
jgi:hypothetical protein